MAGGGGAPPSLPPSGARLRWARARLPHTTHPLLPLPLCASQDDLHFAKGREYKDWTAYGQSKKANMLEARELADQLRSEAPHVTVASLHPGIIATNLARHMTMLRNPLVRWIFSTFIVDKSIAQGAATTLFACLSPAVVSGEYYSDCALGPVDEEGRDAGGAKRKALWLATEAQLKAAAEAGAP